MIWFSKSSFVGGCEQASVSFSLSFYFKRAFFFLSFYLQCQKVNIKNRLSVFIIAILKQEINSFIYGYLVKTDALQDNFDNTHWLIDLHKYTYVE